MTLIILLRMQTNPLRIISTTLLSAISSSVDPVVAPVVAPIVAAIVAAVVTPVILSGTYNYCAY